MSRIGADQRGDADPDVEEEADRDVERHPRQIEQRRRPEAGQEAAYLIEIADRLQTVARRSRLERQPHEDVEHAPAQGFVERGADADEHASAQHVEHALERVEHESDHRQSDERRDAPARQHAIVDLEHEERARQVEHVDHAAHQADAEESVTATRQNRPKLGPSPRARIRIRRVSHAALEFALSREDWDLHLPHEAMRGASRTISKRLRKCCSSTIRSSAFGRKTPGGGGRPDVG